jgi:hypothetical protein
MGRVYATIMLLVAGSLDVAAQRLDGCVNGAVPDAHGPVHAVSQEERNRGLEGAGYLLTRNSLVSALSDPRADVRSIAASTLQGAWGKAELAPITQAWFVETDFCTRARMASALSRIGDEVAADAKQHPGGQQRVTPFQPCTPSEPSRITFTMEQEFDYSTAAVRIAGRNDTTDTLVFVGLGSPTQFFSVTVTDSTGQPVEITKGQEWMYQPDDHKMEHGLGSAPVFWPLPQKESWSIWRVGDDFDMSAPGTYRVSFGGRINYLDTTVCSNTLWMTVK